MDIAAMSIAVSQQNLMQQVNIALLDKNMDTVSEAGDSMAKMMEQSVNPELGTNVDIRV